MRKKNDHITSKFTLIVLSGFCIATIALSVFAPSLTGPVRNIANMLIVPSEKGISSFGNWLGSLTRNMSDSADLREENTLLREQVDKLTAENSQLVLDKAELVRLQSLVELKKEYEEYPTTGARVISKDTGNWFNSFTIDKGSQDGIQVGCNVIGDAGLIGIVTSVGPDWAYVRSIIDDNSSVSAMVESTQDTCIVAGNLELLDAGTLSLVKLRDADNEVHVGDKIVTSNISEKFLPGILIGYISALNNDSNNLTKSGEITPVVDFEHLQEVLVILELKQYVASPEDSKNQQKINDIG